MYTFNEHLLFMSLKFTIFYFLKWHDCKIYDNSDRPLTKYKEEWPQLKNIAVINYTQITFSQNVMT